MSAIEGQDYETYKFLDEWRWRGLGDHSAHSSITGFSSEEKAQEDAKDTLALFIRINESLKDLGGS